MRTIVTHLVLSVVVLGQLDQLVAQLEEVADVVISLVPQLSHLQKWTSTTAVERGL